MRIGAQPSHEQTIAHIGDPDIPASRCIGSFQPVVMPIACGPKNVWPPTPQIVIKLSSYTINPESICFNPNSARAH